jgi:putative aldouronate transport system permease protein
MASQNRTGLERAEGVIIVSVLLALVVITVQPILNLLAISLTEPANAPGMSGLAVIPDGLSFDIWTLLANHPAVQRGLINSFFRTLTGTVLNVTCTALMAWALSRKNLPFRRTIFILVLVTIVFEPGIIPDYFVMRRLGLLDEYAAVIIFKMVNAWYLIILIRFFEEIPNELIEAAELDGANPFQIFWRVVLPLAKPALATITLFYVVYHWNDFLRPMIYFNDQDKWPLQVVLRQFVLVGDKAAIVGLEAMNNYTGASQIDFKSFRAGMILFTILPVLAIYPLILRYFTKGTMSGAVK